LTWKLKIPILCRKIGLLSFGLRSNGFNVKAPSYVQTWLVDSFCCPFSFYIQLVLKVGQQVDSSLLIQVVAGSVMEGASLRFHGDYKKRCLLTILESQILLLTQQISEIKKSTRANGVFSTLI